VLEGTGGLGHLSGNSFVELFFHRVSLGFGCVKKQKKPAEKSARRLSFSPAYATTDRPDQGRDAPRLVFR
jgi:hypothetical protein